MKQITLTKQQLTVALISLSMAGVAQAALTISNGGSSQSSARIGWVARTVCLKRAPLCIVMALKARPRCTIATAMAQVRMAIQTVILLMDTTV